MAGRNYDRLSIEEFGKHLLDSNDLDPIYVALVGTGLPEDDMKRWLLAYWCFYDAGVASFISEQDKYWDVMMAAAANVSPAPTGGRWRRAKERRHFRGKAATTAVEKLRDRYSWPEQMVDFCIGDDPERTCQEVMNRAKEHHLFGDWIAFKVADMVERCLAVPVSFDQAATFMFRDPTDSALMLWEQRVSIPAGMSAKPRNQAAAIEEVVEYLTNQFKHYPAPPGSDRPVGLQEVETILCKWKSHMGGHYPLFNDQDEINEGLVPWLGHSETARKFADAMPRRGDV